MQLLEQAQSRRALGQGAVKILKTALALAESLRGLRQLMLRGLHFIVGAALLGARTLEALLLRLRASRGGRPGLPHLRERRGELGVPHHAGLRVDFVTGAVRAQARHRAFQLQQLEFRLLELLVLPAHFALHNGEFAVALLEHGVRAAEQVQLKLFVLGAAVHLRRHLAQLHFELGEVVAARLDPFIEPGFLDGGNAGLILRLLLLGAEIEDGLLGLLRALVEVAAPRLDLVQLALAGLQRRPLPLARRPPASDVRLQPGDRGA